MTRVFRQLLPAALLISLALIGAPAYAQHSWPIDPTNSEHPIGNSFGESQNFGGPYQHTGIDILERPRLRADGTVDSTAPWARAPVGGTVTYLSDGAATLYNGAAVQGIDGVTYRFWHLEHGSYDPSFVTNFNNGTAVAPNDRIAQLVRWVCDYHHLHYDLTRGAEYLSPLADITPHHDAESSQIAALYFVRDNSDPWVEFRTLDPGGCVLVTGAVDILAQIRDRDNAGSSLTGAQTVWVRTIRWRACPESSPDCPWHDTYGFDSMPTAWGSAGNAFSSAYFSTRTPWNSDSNYCAATWLYAVVTNFVGGMPDAAGNWDTTVIPDSTYTVSIEATDFAGNVRVATTRACVQNNLASFSAAPISGSVPLYVSFTDTSLQNPSSWSWNFGDGGTSTDRNPGHTYKAAGTYSVTLTMSNAGGAHQKTALNLISVSACAEQPVRIGGTSSASLQLGYDTALAGDTIQAQALDFSENLGFSANKAVTLKGGFTCDYSARIPETILRGTLTVSQGTLTIDGLAIR